MGDDPGAFANSLKGICTVFTTSALAFAGIKLVGLAASETPNPPLPLPCHLSISLVGKGPCSQCDYPHMFSFHQSCTCAMKSNLFH